MYRTMGDFALSRMPRAAWYHWLIVLAVAAARTPVALAQPATESPSASERPATRSPVIFAQPHSIPLPSAYAPGPASRWEWRQILTPLRFGLSEQTLHTMTVDPSDPQKIYVGTSSGTIMFTQDGGITWDERTVTPFVTEEWTGEIRIPFIGLNPLLAHSAAIGPGGFHSFEEGRIAQGLGAAEIGQVAAGGIVSPSSWIPIPIGPGGFPPTLLSGNIRLWMFYKYGKNFSPIPVTDIAVCPGGRHSLLMATERDLVGSDDGNSYYSLYRIPDMMQGPTFSFIACSPGNPNDIMVGTYMGLMRSTDGGVHFDESIVRGAPQGDTSAVFYGPPVDQNGGPILWFGSGETLYRGDPDSENGLEYNFPDQLDLSLAPYGDINRIWTNDSTRVFLATSEGLVVTRDGGQSWARAGGILFRRPSSLLPGVLDVWGGKNEEGGERIVAVMSHDAFESDDGGYHWRPYFFGLTPHPLVRVTASELPNHKWRWLILTTRELWASSEIEELEAGHVGNASWARSQLAQTPPLRFIMEAVQQRYHIHSRIYDQWQSQAARAALMPRIDARFFAGNRTFLLNLNQILVPLIRDERWSMPTVEFFVQATWNLADVAIWSDSEAPMHARTLFMLDRQLRSAVEDAWNERIIHLRRLASRRVDRLETHVLRARIDALEETINAFGNRQFFDKVLE